MRSKKMFRIAYELGDWALEEIWLGNYKKFKRIKKVADKYREMYLKDEGK